jgi:hypothetical protein
MKFCILMWYDKDISCYGDLNYKINKAYCDKYNIELICCNKRRHVLRHPAWERIPLILEYINKYDYVMWIDADAHFYIDSKNIVDFINENSTHNIIFSQDMNLISINTGCFIVKNTKYSIDFLTKWCYDNNLYINNRYPYWWDQGVILDMYEDNILDIQNNSIIINYGILQHFYFSELKNWSVKPYIFHLAGRTSNFRLIHSINYTKYIGI